MFLCDFCVFKGLPDATPKANSEKDKKPKTKKLELRGMRSNWNEPAIKFGTLNFFHQKLTNKIFF